MNNFKLDDHRNDPAKFNPSCNTLLTESVDIVIDDSNHYKSLSPIRYFMEKIPAKEIYNIFRYDSTRKRIQYIYRYTDPQGAIDALSRLNGQIDILELQRQAYASIYDFIITDRNHHRLIMNILVIFSFGNDYNFNELTKLYETFITTKEDRTRLYNREREYDDYNEAVDPTIFTSWEVFRVYCQLNPLARIYDRLYDLIVIERDSFTGKKYDDLSFERFADVLMSITELFDINYV